MSAYIKCTDTGANAEWRVYQPVAYRGPDPSMPLWQVDVFRRNHRNGTTIQYAGDVIGWVGRYHTHWMRGTNPTSDATWLKFYAATDWVRYRATGAADTGFADWASGTTTLGSDDALVSSANSNIVIRNQASKPYCFAELTVTHDLEGDAALDIVMGFLSDTDGWAPGGGKLELWRLDPVSATYKLVPLNGRGQCVPLWKQSSATMLPRACTRHWDNRGVADHIGASGTNNASRYEIARNLPPGTYKIRAVVLDNTRIYIGGVRLLRQSPTVTPADTRAFEHISEFAYATSATDDYNPGPMGVYWNQSADWEIAHASDNSSYANGPNYGHNRQVSVTVTADGADITTALLAMSAGDVLGGYSQVQWTIVDDVFRATCHIASASILSGASVSSISGSDVDVGVTLTGVSVGDWLLLTGRTTGVALNNSPAQWFKITALPGGTTVTVHAAPGAGTAVAWQIRKMSGGTAASNGGSGAALTLDATADLSTIAIGDYVRLIGRTDGLGTLQQRDWFEVTAVDDAANTMTVSPVPSGSVSGVAWDARERYVTATKVYTFRDRKMDVAISAAWRKACTVSRLYAPSIGGLSYTSNGQYQSLQPRHPHSAIVSVFPYTVTRISERNDYLGTEWGDTWLTLPSLTSGGGVAGLAQASSMSGEGPAVTHRVFHYDLIEGAANREIGRELAIETPYRSWTNTEYDEHTIPSTYSAAVNEGGTWHAGGNNPRFKSYVSAIVSDSFTTASAPTVVTFSLQSAERGYTQAGQVQRPAASVLIVRRRTP